MKISVDGILGSAQNIKNQRQVAEENTGNRKKEVRSDSVSISSKVNTRLDSIDTEIRDIQSSLTRNQMLRDGIEELRRDMDQGGREQERILSDVRFEGKPVLKDFLGELYGPDPLKAKHEQATAALGDDINRLKKLQVELDNITASNLAGSDRIESTMKRVDTLFSTMEAKNIEGISSLNADSVKRLIQ